jgi:uncharacterized protein (TIGR00299 family) protein
VIAYLDCSTGVSGDKFLGALVDAGTRIAEQGGSGFTAEDLSRAIACVAPEAVVAVERVSSRGISALSIAVTADGDAPHRHWSDIRALIGDAEGLAPQVRADALAAFEALALAEAEVHGADVEGVHFHEVGAIDSIADIVGVCAGMHALGIERLVVSPVAVGSGTVETSHGTLAVPAPATAALLVGAPIVPGPAAGELTTPTGAALVATLGNGYGPPPAMLLGQSGYGAGTRDIGLPNVCRIMLGDADNATPHDGPITQRVVLLETNIDHVAPEELAFVAEELLAAGALDVWQSPIVMKKGRSAVALSVLAADADADPLALRVITLTGSLGVRRTVTERLVAPRESRSIATPWGPVRVKIGAGRVRPEHDDVARIAREQGLPYAELVREIERLANA